MINTSPKPEASADFLAWLAPDAPSTTAKNSTTTPNKPTQAFNDTLAQYREKITDDRGSSIAPARDKGSRSTAAFTTEASPKSDSSSGTPAETNPQAQESAINTSKTSGSTTTDHESDDESSAAVVPVVIVSTTPAATESPEATPQTSAKGESVVVADQPSTALLERPVSVTGDRSTEASVSDKSALTSESERKPSPTPVTEEAKPAQPLRAETKPANQLATPLTETNKPGLSKGEISDSATPAAEVKVPIGIQVRPAPKMESSVTDVDEDKPAPGEEGFPDEAPGDISRRAPLKMVGQEGESRGRGHRDGQTHGTDGAKIAQQMQNTAQKGPDQFPTGQALPSRTPSAPPAPAVEILGPQENQWRPATLSNTTQSSRPSSAIEILPHSVQPVQLSESSPGSALRPAEALPVTAAEKIQLRIMNGAMEMRASRSESMSVVIRPDSGTEMVLHLVLHNGLVDVEARLHRGDLGALAQQWNHLQQSLSQQGIRLTALLTPEATQDQFSQHFDQSDFQKEQPAPHEQEDSAWTPLKPDTTPAPRASRSISNLQTAPGSFESWA